MKHIWIVLFSPGDWREPEVAVFTNKKAADRYAKTFDEDLEEHGGEVWVRKQPLNKD